MENPRDRERLAKRNRRLAAFQHRLTWREKLRRRLLRAYTWLPKPGRQKPIKGTVLLIRPDHIGDMLLTTPAVRALKGSDPKLKLVGLAGPWSADILAAFPEVDLVLTLPFPGFTRQPNESLMTPYTMAWQWALKVRQVRAETAIILRPDHWWGALLAYMAGIPNRIGYDLPDVAPFLTKKISFAPEHAVLQSMRLIEKFTGVVETQNIDYSFPIMEEDRAYVSGLLGSHQIPVNRPIVAIHAGAGTLIKQWTPQRWATVADRLTDRLKATVVFTGGDREHGAIFQIMDLMRNNAVSLAGDTNLEQLAAVYERAMVVLGADSGPMHLAVASGAPTVHLFGPADPAEFGPWGDSVRQVVITSDIGCRPCRIIDWPGDDAANHPCIRDITPQQVIEAAMDAAKKR